MYALCLRLGGCAHIHLVRYSLRIDRRHHAERQLVYGVGVEPYHRRVEPCLDWRVGDICRELHPLVHAVILPSVERVCLKIDAVER